MTPRDPRAATSRTKGAVGTNPLVYRVFRERFTPQQINAGLAVLDFGAGKGAVHTQRLRLEGYANVWAWDLPDNQPDRNQPDCLSLLSGWTPHLTAHAWEVVLLSNVLNVQTSQEQIENVILTVRNIMGPGSTLICNYPEDPRKSNCSASDIIGMFSRMTACREWQQAAGTRSAPCWVLKY